MKWLSIVLLLNFSGPIFAGPESYTLDCLNALQKILESEKPHSLESSRVNQLDYILDLKFKQSGNFDFKVVDHYVYSQDTKPVVHVFYNPNSQKFENTLFIDKESLLSSMPSKEVQNAVRKYVDIRTLPLLKKEEVMTGPVKQRSFEYGDVKNLEWQKIFIRSEADRTADITYIEAMVNNVTNSMKQVEEAVFKRKQLSVGNYRDFLVKQMKMIITEKYRGYVYGDISKDAEMSGKLIHEKWFTPPSAWRRMVERSAIGADVPVGSKPLRYTQTFSGIQLDIYNHRSIGSQHTFHRYPAKEDRIKVMARLSEMFNELKDDITLGHEDEIFFEHLSDYYHLGINCHLFYRGNNSIFMSHVNFLLMSRGFKGIPHGRLDYIALGENHVEFRRILMKAIAEENPNIKDRLIDVAL